MSVIARVRQLAGWTSPAWPEMLRLRAVVATFPAVTGTDACGKLVNEILSKEPKSVTWDDIEAVRAALVPLMPFAFLQAEFWSLSAEYQNVAGAKPFVGTSFPSPPAKLEEWQAGVAILLADLAKMRRAKLMFERMRSILGLTFGILLPITAIVGFLFYQRNYWNSPGAQPPLWPPLLFAGFLGGGFSVLIRLYSLSWSPSVSACVQDQQAIKKGLVVNCVLSMAEGIIAAAAVYLLCASRLLEGDLFPKFVDPKQEPSTNGFLQFLSRQPEAASDTAKLFVCAFIAGFAERLVPDKLNQLAGQAEGPKSKA